MSDNADGVKVIKAYFNKQFHEQAMLLTEVPESLNLFNPTILNAIHRTPRHMLLPGNLAPLAYWNGVTPIRGTVALTSPWMTAYAALRLALRPAQRVLVLGYGYGYITLAFANIVGPEGEVVAVELDKDLVECGRQLLKHLNIMNVKIIHGDALDLRRQSWNVRRNLADALCQDNSIILDVFGQSDRNTWRLYPSCRTRIFSQWTAT
jgi:SAM-dependent methyltransferase